jgi:hypothetical protein
MGGCAPSQLWLVSHIIATHAALNHALAICPSCDDNEKRNGSSKKDFLDGFAIP